MTSPGSTRASRIETVRDIRTLASIIMGHPGELGPGDLTRTYMSAGYDHYYLFGRPYAIHDLVLDKVTLISNAKGEIWE